MLLGNKKFTFDRVVRIAIGAGILWGFVRLLAFLSDVLIPFAIAVLLAYLINPIVTWIQKRIPNRVAAVAITLVLCITILFTAVILLLPLILGEIAETGKMLTQLNNANLQQFTSRVLPADFWEALRQFTNRDDVQAFFRTDKFAEMLQEYARKILPGIWGVITGTASLMLGILGLTIVLLYLIFVLIDFEKLKGGWPELIPPEYRAPIKDFVNEFNEGMKRYFRRQAVIAGIVGSLFALGFWLIGLPMGIFLGLFVGFLNMIPYLQIVGLIPAFLLALIEGVTQQGSIWLLPLLTALVFVVVQSIQDIVLTPKIHGKGTGLSPAMILLSLSIWGKLLGLFGLLIALPMTCLLLAYYRKVIAAEGPNAFDRLDSAPDNEPDSDEPDPE